MFLGVRPRPYREQILPANIAVEFPILSCNNRQVRDIRARHAFDHRIEKLVRIGDDRSASPRGGA